MELDGLRCIKINLRFLYLSQGNLLEYADFYANFPAKFIDPHEIYIY